jgi:serine/threonine-protein kinase
VVHRDLCPQNVLLSRNGEVKIADFGVARALRDAQTAHTRTTAGHLGYLAPEQARGLGVDERTDLFAVGVMLWELMAGRRLFLLDTEAATVMALLALEPVPVSALREDADPAWDSFLEKSLAREPAARARSAREMAAALDSIPGARGERCAERLVELVEACRSGSGDSDGVARALPTLDLSPPGSGAE